MRHVRKWLLPGSNRYGVAASVAAAAAVGSPLIAETLPSSGALKPIAIGIAVVAAFLTWSLKNAERYEGRTQQQADIDELLDVLDDTLSSLNEIASADPDDPLARAYVEQVASALRRRLDPEGHEKFVRVCVYRRDQQEFEGLRDGPEVDDSEPAAPEAKFVRYVYSRGRRPDEPRRTFSDAVEPGKSFLPHLMTHGRYTASSPADFSGDDPRYSDGQDPRYESFVNIALTDSAGDAYAMLTCDAPEANFFDDRREMLIRAFSRLIGVALTRGATRPEVSRPLELLWEARRDEP